MKFDLDDPILTAYALGELDADQATEVERQMAENAPTRQAVDEIRAAAWVLSDELRRESNAWSLRELWRAVVVYRQKAQQFRKPASSHYWTRAGLALAAMLAISAALLSVWLRKPEDGRRTVADRDTPADGRMASTTGFGDVHQTLVGPQPIGMGVDSAGLVHSPFVTIDRSTLSSFPLARRAESYATVRKAIAAGRLPSRDAVRVDELINAFEYSAVAPSGDAALAAVGEIAQCPWTPGNRIARITVAAKASTQSAIVARDARVTVEFNPKRVAAYRLIGYESRLAAPEDSDRRDDIAAGQRITALYEIVPSSPGSAGIVGEDLKYLSSRRPTAAADSGEVLSLQLRYRDSAGAARTDQFALVDLAEAIDVASDDMRFVAAVASFGMILRDSPHKGSASLEGVLALAGADRPDLAPRRAEFVELVRRTQTILQKT